MTDSVKLTGIIRDSGLKRAFIADKLGISPHSLAKKINNVTEFKANEIKCLSQLLGIRKKDEIFFA